MLSVRHWVICSKSATRRPTVPSFLFMMLIGLEKWRKPGRAGWGQDIRLQKLIQKRVEMIGNVARKANAFVNACDYDIEGETIGSNILDFVCGRPEMIRRAKFSTLTQEDIRRAFTTLEPSRNSLAKAGRIRHEVDFLWGINLSRALTQSANKSESKFANVTIGRVQGPTLAFIVDREIERTSHVPIPLWAITCTLKKDNDAFEVYLQGFANSQSITGEDCL